MKEKVKRYFNYFIFYVQYYTWCIRNYDLKKDKYENRGKFLRKWYSDRLIKNVITRLDNAEVKETSNIGTDTFVGVIPDDWERRINDRIDQYNLDIKVKEEEYHKKLIEASVKKLAEPPSGMMKSYIDNNFEDLTFYGVTKPIGDAE